MSKQTVIRDAAGNVINIGPWDFVKTVETDLSTGEDYLVINNPMPDGCYESTAEITTLPDGGLSAE
ncbi:hypothetical protein IME11_91 [Escherichia phage IME11]|uniref:Uncharacterized protein n=1 Tax=Escherichia phage IME11 TaxID=1239384 RepID=K4MMG6_9CAUD|nr:hypothetical protein IME11_91 [Escherichia phage IME11]AFV29140.1 hypothetical protein IME11_91 [Escherichia phage IME11]